MPTLNLPELIAAVQHNCDVSDARHARDYGLCTYLLKMREYYRWENDLPYFRALPRADIGEWLTKREQRWNEIESSSFRALPLPPGDCDPFDGEAANRALVPLGYVYSAGYGRHRKPHFFLGRLERREQHAGLTVLVSGCEYARDLVAPPAMMQRHTAFIRQESLRRYLWEKFEESGQRSNDSPIRRALACYDFDADPEQALTEMTESETRAAILHEIGEAMAGQQLGEPWEQMLNAAAGARAELAARAVRDHLADCLSTLPALIEHEDHASLHFYFANLDGMRRELFPAAAEAYEHWHASGDATALRALVARGREHWRAAAREFLAAHAADGAIGNQRAQAIEERIRL